MVIIPDIAPPYGTSGWELLGTHPLTKPCLLLVFRFLDVLRALRSPAFPRVKHLSINFDAIWIELSCYRAKLQEIHLPGLRSLNIGTKLHLTETFVYNCNNIQSFHAPAGTFRETDGAPFQKIRRLCIPEFVYNKDNVLQVLPGRFPNLRELAIEGFDRVS